MSAYRTEQLKRFDRVGTPAACLAGDVLSRLGRRRTPDPRTLAVRPGGMGDLIAAQIAVEELGRDPRTDVLWIVERRSQAWARHAGLPHRCYDAGGAALLREIAGRHAVVVNTEQRFGLSHAVARAARATGGRVIAPSTNRAARWAEPVPYDPYDEHETVAMRRLFAAAWDLPLTAAPRPRVRRERSTGELVIAISGRQSASRSLPVATWAAIARAWAGERAIVVTGAPVDRAFADDLAASLGNRARREDFGFGALVERIATAEGLLTVDGGPVHIASYAGVPTRAIFTSGRDRKWAPLAEGSDIVRTSGLPCQPCTLFGQTPLCPNGLACQRLDGVRDVRPAQPGLAVSPR